MTQTAINLIKAPNISVSANITDNEGVVHTIDVTLRTMRNNSLICDIKIDGNVECYGRQCVNKMPLLLKPLISGNVYFIDQYGNEDPSYTGYNDRFLLIYDTEYSFR